MKFTLSWLKDHLDTDATLDEVVERLTMLGLEVEGVEDRAEGLQDFVVGEVLAAEKHPDADKLQILSVFNGTDTLQVHIDAVSKGAEVLMVDDLLATGGTMAAACKLIEKIGGKIAGITFLIELVELSGRKKLTGYKINTCLSY